MSIQHICKRNLVLYRAAAPIALLLASLAVPVGSRAQAKAGSEPDTVTFPDGEKLVGHFESFANGTAKFKSDSLGEVSVDLSKVQEMHVSGQFAVIPKGVKLSRGETDGQIPRGTIAVTNKTVEVNPGNNGTVRNVAVGDLSNIIDEAAFEQAFHRPGFFQNWGGAATLGTSLVEATQNSLSVNTSISLLRAVPTATWLPPRNRTSFDFSDSYGKVTQPGVPTVKTSIYHADAERDEYFTTQVFAFGAASFDHNFSQGLDLQQIYGGGIGWSVIHASTRTLDLKGSLDYEKQQFQVATQNKNLLTSVFSEYYMQKLIHGIALVQQLSASPAWTDTKAYSAYGSVGLTFPVYKRFGFNVNVIDSYLNDPPPGFKNNSFQFNTGVSYTLP